MPGQALGMPIRLDRGGNLGGAVHAVQVIGAWARMAGSSRTLILPSAFGSQPSTRERFGSTLPGMAALYFAETIQCGGKSISRFKALEDVAPYVAAMQAGAFRNTLRGQGVALCCFIGAKSEFLTPLYATPSPGGVREFTGFRVLLPRMLSQIGVRDDSMNEGQLDYLTTLVHQLFLNADEHGSFNEVGERYSLGLRGIAIRRTVVRDVRTLVQFAGNDGPLKSYLYKLAMKGARKAKGADYASDTPQDEDRPIGPIHLIEISVFDTGPGLGLRWLSEKDGRRSYAEISDKEEEDAVSTCFTKHATTTSSQFKGQGLSIALMALKRLEAFMTLRTGRLSLYQDLSRTDTTEFKPRKRFQSLKTLPEIAGTAYSICFRVKPK